MSLRKLCLFILAATIAGFATVASLIVQDQRIRGAHAAFATA